MHDAFNVSDKPVVSGLHDRIESLLLYAGRLFIGCQNGSLHVYTLELAAESENGQPTANKERVIEGFSKKSIEQLGVIKETNSLVSLSNGTISLHDIHTFEKQTVLGSGSLTKAQANLFAIDTSIQHSEPSVQSATPSKGKTRDQGTKSSASTSASVQQRRRDGGRAISTKTGQVDKPSSPTVLTSLVVACRRRLCLFHWRDGQWQEPKEVSLPHQVRSIALPVPHSVFLGFSTSEYGTISLPYVQDTKNTEQPKLSELFSPTPSHQQSSMSSSGGGASASHTLGAIPGLGTLGGLAAKTGGYMGLVGKVDRNLVVKVKTNEVLAIKENIGMLLDGSGAPARPLQIDYALPPEESVVSWPYILSVLPAPVTVGQLSKQQAQDPLTALPTVHIHSAPTLSPVQALRVPVPSKQPDRPVSILDVPPTPVAQSARLLTLSPTSRPTLAIVTNSASENSQTTTGSSDSKIWILSGRSWTAQIDQLVSLGEYQQALALLQSIDNADFAVPDAMDRARHLRMLVGLNLFLDEKNYDRAIDIFIEENVNPAKVVALFPKDIAGKLHRPREEIEEIWGGRTRANRQQQDEASKRLLLGRKRSMPIPGAADDSVIAGKDGDSDRGASGSPSQQSSSWRFSPMRRRETSREDDTVSVKSLASKRSMTGLNASKASRDSAGLRASSTEREGTEDISFDKSVDVLMRYLPDRRQQFLRALASLPSHSRPTPASPLPDTSGTSAEALFALPDSPLSSYSAGDLQRVARVVETALFKCYLHAKPVLLGPLCRIENWCEVEEVEELLLQAKKYRELLDLYNGKHMHEKALKLLRRMADEEVSENARDKVDPTITYVQKLGPDHLDLIFAASEWIFSLSAPAGLEIFTADVEEVERLPRHAVSNHLAKVAPTLQYAQYLEHIIHHLNESGPEFHERLIEIYLERIKKEMDGKRVPNAHETIEELEDFKKLIKFLESSTQYRADRLLNRIGDGAMDEVKAILLGKLGKHDGALQIYVHKLKDNARAEEYCKRVYEEETSASKRSTIFVTLLNVYLLPYQQRTTDPSSVGDNSDQVQGKPLLEPALRLLALYGVRMDANHVLEILPPLLTVQELRTFLNKSIRKSISWKHNNKVVRRIRTARMDEVEQGLVDLEGRRVKITDSRLCPQCHKRLGNSVIAIHSPHGEVTHYQCREKWIEARRHRLNDGSR